MGKRTVMRKTLESSTEWQSACGSYGWLCRRLLRLSSRDDKGIASVWVSWGSQGQSLSIGLGYSDKKERISMIDNCAFIR